MTGIVRTCFWGRFSGSGAPRPSRADGSNQRRLTHKRTRILGASDPRAARRSVPAPNIDYEISTRDGKAVGDFSLGRSAVSRRKNIWHEGEKWTPALPLPSSSFCAPSRFSARDSGEAIALKGTARKSRLPLVCRRIVTRLTSAALSVGKRFTKASVSATSFLLRAAVPS